MLVLLVAAAKILSVKVGTSINLACQPCKPASLPICQPASLPACQPASLPACQPASLPACQIASLLACRPFLCLLLGFLFFKWIFFKLICLEQSTSLRCLWSLPTVHLGSVTSQTHFSFTDFNGGCFTEGLGPYSQHFIFFATYESAQ
jgi:hypothetical protein